MRAPTVKKPMATGVVPGVRDTGRQVFRRLFSSSSRPGPPPT
ncbi:hypothetical protein [Kitasatospora sp. NPDC057500]